MSFEPLAYVWGTTTVWHFAFWGAFLLLCLLPAKSKSDKMPIALRLNAGLVIPPVLCAMITLILGQIWGDKFSWSQLWRSGLIVGATLASTFLTFGLGVTRAERSSTDKLGLGIFLGLLGFLIAALFFGLGLAGIFYLIPRAFANVFEPQPVTWAVQL